MMIETIYPYIDLAWLLVALPLLHRRQRLWAACFFLMCFAMMRLLIELLESVGYPRGILPVLDAPLFLRGLIVYSVFYMLYIVLAVFSPGGFTSVFVAASLSIFFLASIAAAIVMIL